MQATLTPDDADWDAAALIRQWGWVRFPGRGPPWYGTTSEGHKEGTCFMRRTLAAFFVIAILFTSLPAMAQVTDEGTDPTIGIPVDGQTVVLVRDNGTAKYAGIKAQGLAPTSGDFAGDGTANQVRANARDIVEERSFTRMVYVWLAKRTGTNTYLVLEVDQINYGGGEKHGSWRQHPGDPVTCAGGSGEYATGVTIDKESASDTPHSDIGSVVILPFNCS